MHENEIKIIKIFKKSKKKDLATSKIVEAIYPNKNKEIETILEFPFKDKEKTNLAKRTKAQLHRKVLYHINKLVEDEILKVSRIEGKGQKFFSLSIGEGEEIIIQSGKTKTRNKIIITKPNLPAMPIEGYEQQELVKKYEENTWINRANSCIIQSKNVVDIHKLKEIVIESFSYVNDVIGINDFETIIEKSINYDLIDFIEAIEEECKDFGKSISLIIDFSNIINPLKIEEFMKSFAAINPASINFILDTTSKELNEHEDTIANLIESFSEAKIPIHIKNQECHDAPYILGKAGPYTFRPIDWDSFREEFQGKVTTIICGQSTLTIDVGEFFRKTDNKYQFREFILNIAKSLLYSNSLQRSRSNEYFKYLIELNKPISKNLFTYSRNYIRFWNYGWKEQNTDPEIIFNLIESTKESTTTFCKSEESIYKSCGMPSRFKIGFSCAFKESTKEKFSEEKFKKIEIKKSEDLYKNDIKKLITEKEKIFKIFDGGDRLRFYRRGNFESMDVVREFKVIVNTYKIPFFCYNFSEIKDKDTRLTNFMEEKTNPE